MNNYLASLVPALANHLWQSTAFAAAAWLSTVALRKNSARVRYGIWLAASMKFLVPFAFLIATGAWLAKSPRPVAPAVYSAMKISEQPFADISSTFVAPITHAPTLAQRIAAGIPAALLAFWLVGTLAVLAIWWLRWRKASVSLRSAIPVAEPRELLILRRLQAHFGTGPASSLSLRLSTEQVEPSVHGILWPILVWPRKLSDHLSNEQMEAIMAHELAHARRFDNATAALHMLVEALFWCHPVVWWMERRMIEERERACDEAVVALGGNPDVYAEGILRTCRFCVESPLPCVAGVTGADLKKRVVGIVSARTLARITWQKKIVIGAAALCLLTTPVILGQLQAPMSFEVVSIKKFVPDDHIGPPYRARGAGPVDASRWRAVGVTAKSLIGEAYGVQDFQISGGPPWIANEPWNIDAKVDDATAARLQNMSRQEQAKQMDPMLQTLLQDRFKLQVTHETKEGPAYTLVVGKGGPKLKETAAGEPSAASFTFGPNLFTMTTKGTQIGGLAGILKSQLKRTVLDQTGLTGSYDIDLRFVPPGTLATDPSAADSSGESIFDALQDQLGLKLVSTTAPIDTITINHIEEPTPN